MKNANKIFSNLALVSQIGFTIIVILVGCILLGKFLDDLFNTKVVFLIIFTLLGILSAFNYIYRMGIQGIDRKKQRKGK